MDYEAALRRDLLAAFEFAHYRDNWVVPLSEVLDGETAEEAAWKPGPDMRSIGEIVLHLTVWVTDALRFLRGEQDAEGHPEVNWPALPSEWTEATWDDARQALFAELEALRAAIEMASPADLLERQGRNRSLFVEVLCRLIHSAYHIGQIVLLRECQEAGNHPQP